MTYDESVEVATVAKHLADQAHQFTQYGGVRPNGVAMIIAGVDQKGESIYITDPSGTYVQFSAIAIGNGSEDVNEFLEKFYTKDMSLEDAASLAIAAINLKAEIKKMELMTLKWQRLQLKQKFSRRFLNQIYRIILKMHLKFATE